MSMKLALLSACLLLGLAACNKSQAGEKLTGMYELDKTANLPMFVEMVKKQDAKLDDAKAKEAGAKALEATTMSLDLKADGTFVFRMAMMGMPAQDASGNWKVEGDKVVTTAKKEGSKDEVHEGTISGDSLKFTEDMGGQKMTFIVTKKK
jgi:hypothetical protein